MDKSLISVVRGNASKIKKGAKVNVILNAPIQIGYYLNIDNATFVVVFPPKKLDSNRFEHTLKALQYVHAEHINEKSFIVMVEIGDKIVYDTPHKATDKEVKQKSTS